MNNTCTRPSSRHRKIYILFIKRATKFLLNSAERILCMYLINVCIYLKKNPFIKVQQCGPYFRNHSVYSQFN